jgi:TolB-like protein
MKINKLILTTLVSILIILDGSAAAAKETNIALFEFDVNSREELGYLKSGISALLPSRISVPKKINVIDDYRIKKELAKNPKKTLPNMTSIAEKLGADFMVFGSITKLGENISIDASLVDILNDKKSTPVFIQSIGIDNMIPEINNFAKKIKGLITGEQGVSIPDAYLRNKDLSSKKQELPTEKTAAEPLLTEEPVYEAPVRRQTRSEIAAAPKPVFEKTSPLLKDEPSITHIIKHTPLSYLATGDINGDGKQELLVAGDSKILVFQINNNTLIPAGEIKTKVTTSIVRIDTANLNNNETDEIYISSYDGRAPNSLVIEYQEGKYETLFESKIWFFRVMENNVLLGQKADNFKIFLGAIHVLEWKKDEIISREEILLPNGVSLYGYTEGDIDKDIDDEYIAFHKSILNSGYQLVILSYTGRIEWQDTEKLGGTPNTLTELPFGDDTERLLPIPLRVLCEDYNSNDSLDLITARNSKSKKGLLSKMAHYNQGEVMCLHWNGSDLEKNWTTGIIKGYVTDYIMADFDNDDKKELIMLSVSDEGFWGKAKNTIRVYKLSE